MANQKLKNILKDPRTNWKYILILVILAILVGGGILGYSLRIKKEIKITEVKPPEKEIKAPAEEFVEVSLGELKEGENKIGEIIVKKIELSEIHPIKSTATLKEYKINMSTMKILATNIEDGYPLSYAVYYGNKKIGEGSLGPGADPFSPLKVFTFNYNKTYIIVSGETGGSGGWWKWYEFYVIDNDDLKPVLTSKGDHFVFYEDGSYLILGYEGFLYIMSTSWGQTGACCPWQMLEISILDVNQDTVKEIKDFDGGCSSYDICVCFAVPKIISLIENNKKLYAKINDAYYYAIWDKENKMCEIEESYIYCPVLFYAGIDEYYLLGNGELIRNIQEFKENYLQTAFQYEEILQKEKWEKLCTERGECCKVSNDWLSPLLGRTLNLISAKEEEKAWKEFFEDFAKFSSKYPLEAIKRIDPDTIKEEIQKDISARE